MNLQEVFDKIHAATRTQRTAAMNNTGKCVFISENGCRCFMGMLMTEAQARQAEKEDWSWIRIAAELGIKAYTDEHPQRCMAQSVILDLMRVHDTLPPEEWDATLEKLANEYGVNYPPMGTTT